MQKRTRTLCCTHKILPRQNEQDVVLVVHVHRSENIIALLTAAHAVSQVVVPGVAGPVGILTALVGVPVFLLIIFGRRRSAARGGS